MNMGTKLQGSRKKHSAAGEYAEGAYYLDAKLIFILSLLGGAVAIFIGVYKQLYAIAVTVPVIIMFLYIFIGRIRRGADVALSQFADSVYYLGFLFTLAALTASLVTHVLTELDPTSLTSSFGLALVTTIIGLSARVVLTSFGEEPTDAMVRADEALHDEVQRFSEELRISTDTFKQNSAVSVDTVQNSLTTATDNFKIAIEQATKDFGHALSGSLESINIAGESLSSHIDKIEVPEDLFTGRFTPHLEKFTKSLEQYNQQMSDSLLNQRKVRDGVNLVAKSMERIAKKLDGIEDVFTLADKQLTKLSHIGEHAQTFSTQVGEAVRLMGQLNTSLDSVTRMRQNLEATMGEAIRFTEDLGLINKQLDEIARGTVAGLRPLEDTAESVKVFTESIEGFVHKIVELGDSLQIIEDLQRSFGNLQGENERFQQALQSQNQLMDVGYDQYKAYLHALNEHREALLKDLKAASGALRIMYKQTTDAAKFVVNKLS